MIAQRVQELGAHCAFPRALVFAATCNKHVTGLCMPSRVGVVRLPVAVTAWNWKVGLKWPLHFMHVPDLLNMNECSHMDIAANKTRCCAARLLQHILRFPFGARTLCVLCAAAAPPPRRRAWPPHQRKAYARMPRNYSIPPRTFWCDKCTFSTHSKRAAALHFLDRHLSARTDTRALVCPFCEFCTAYLFSLRRHMKRFHSAETPR
jgi:hypothetical protein